MSDSKFWKIMVYVLALVGAIAMLALRCDKSEDDSNVRRTLEASGFRDIAVTDRGVMTELEGCSKGDDVYYKAIATNPVGQRVSLVVCCGLLFKSCTVRVP